MHVTIIRADGREERHTLQRPMFLLELRDLIGAADVLQLSLDNGARTMFIARPPDATKRLNPTATALVWEAGHDVAKITGDVGIVRLSELLES